MKVVVYPIGTIFNGDYEYDLRSHYTNSTFIYGGEKSNILFNGSFSLDHDGATGVNADNAIGYGKYRIDLYDLFFVMKEEKLVVGAHLTLREAILTIAF